jgi:uncharacterized protein (TIGR03083 family)
MTTLDHLGHLRADADAVLAVVRAADGTEPVAACPGWTLRQLVEHLGGVHRWATGIVASGAPADEPSTEGVTDLAAWFAEGADALIATLAAADRTAPVWSFTTDRTAGFWVRRQALETVVHRWDAQRAVGEPDRIDATLAADGISEVVDLMLPRQVRLDRMPAMTYTVQLTPTDVEATYALGSGDAVATVSGSAEVLLLLLWHRVDPGDPRLRYEGDAAAAQQLLHQPLAP